MEELVTRRVDYAALDRPGAEVRLRLNATALRPAHDAPPEGAARVLVTDAQDGRLARLRAGHVILAFWHRVIPCLTDELPPAQAEALNDQRKVPHLRSNLLLANWRPLADLGIEGVRARGNSRHGFEIDFPLSMGAYRFAENPDDLVVLHLSKVMACPGPPPREQAPEGAPAHADFPGPPRALPEL